MPPMISISSRKVIKFTNQSRKVTPETILKSIGGDTSAMPQDLHFTTTPGESAGGVRNTFGQPELAPAWIKDDPMFEWCVKDGDLMELATAVAKAEEEPEPTVKSVAVDKLQRMNKQELLLHAKEAHDLDLDPAMPKPAVIAKIVDAQGNR